MAVNFRISQGKRKTKNSVRFTLNGDFDGTSAHELINTVKACGKVERVVIDTHGLKSVHPFGQVVLQRNFADLDERCNNIEFLGDHGLQLGRSRVP